VVADDDKHSASEQREITIGFSCRSRLLMVVFTKRYEATIRLISARRATQAEARRYAEGIKVKLVKFTPERWHTSRPQT